MHAEQDDSPQRPGPDKTRDKTPDKTPGKPADHVPNRAPNRTPDQPRGALRIPPVLVVIFLLCSGIELTLSAADAGLIGSARWRPLAYQYGAFWAGLLHNWAPNYPAQPWLMFASYSLLHAGPGHLIGNMATLLTVGTIVSRQVGPGRFLAIYAASALGGGAAFGLLTTSPLPMVGASGALFGLAGAWQYHDAIARRSTGRRLWPVVRMVIGLVCLNIVLWVLLSGRLAWETHLGGFLSGWAMAALLRRLAPDPAHRAQD